MKNSTDVKLQYYTFVNKQTASELTGLSAETLKNIDRQESVTETLGVEFKDAFLQVDFDKIEEFK